MDSRGGHERVEDDGGEDDRGWNGEGDGVHAGGGGGRPHGDPGTICADGEHEREGRQRQAPPDPCSLPRLDEGGAALAAGERWGQVNDRFGARRLDFDV
jgi:hypothetical protein